MVPAPRLLFHCFQSSVFLQDRLNEDNAKLIHDECKIKVSEFILLLHPLMFQNLALNKWGDLQHGFL